MLSSEITKRGALGLIVAVCLWPRAVSAEEYHHHHQGHQHEGAYAPVGVMGDHMHEQGEWMVSYRFMRMDMDETYVGDDKVSTARVLDEFMVAPLSMEMDMHMLGAMYGLTDDITLMLMIPYFEKEMDHRTRMGGMFTTASSGIGDIKLSGLFSVYQDQYQRVHFNFGMSFPSGSIDERDRTPMGPNQILPYPMQPGSGTYDLHPGVTYVGHHDRLSWGLQFGVTQRLGDNDRGYTLGDRYEASSWIAYQPADWITGSFRLRKTYWEDIDGADPDLNSNVVQTADPTRQAGRKLDALFGIDLIGTEDNFFRDQRLAFEVGFPIHVDVNGPQLITDLEYTVGWQKTW